MNFIIKIINVFLNILGSLLGTIINLLPDSPFDKFDTFLSFEQLGYLNWLLPIKEVTEILIIWSGCVAVYYAYSYVMRFFKLIR